MTTVIVVGEGQTEETVVRDILMPRFASREIFLESRLISTSAGTRGGALSRDRVLRFLRNTLRQRSDAYVTTFFDLYRLDRDIPGVAAASTIADPHARTGAIESALAREVIAAAECLPGRFIAHVQPYEFEGLLFSDVTAFARVEHGWVRHEAELAKIRKQSATPEHINDGQHTHPSSRLRQLVGPSFSKVLHGGRILEAIGLDRVRAECPHFNGWLSRIERLES